jgi:hypothetical protein
MLDAACEERVVVEEPVHVRLPIAPSANKFPPFRVVELCLDERSRPRSRLGVPRLIEHPPRAKAEIIRPFQAQSDLSS